MAVVEGSGNVFEDMGLPDAEERLAKADVAIWIDQVIRTRGMTQAEAAQVMGISQADVSKITRGSLRGYTLERLFRCLNALDQDVKIIITPKHAGRARVEVSVS